MTPELEIWETMETMQPSAAPVQTMREEMMSWNIHSMNYMINVCCTNRFFKNVAFLSNNNKFSLIFSAHVQFTATDNQKFHDVILKIISINIFLWIVHLVLSVTNPIREWSEGVDMDFLRESAPGSLGARVGHGVRGTYPDWWSEAGYSGQDPSPTMPRLPNPPNKFLMVAPEEIKYFSVQWWCSKFYDFQSFYQNMAQTFLLLQTTPGRTF